jgi:hypothetical protein
VLSCGGGDWDAAPSQRCPRDEPLCETNGYAHFTISNVRGSGLPHEADYEITGKLITDLVTGLVWDGGPSSEPIGWEEAKARCAALELEGRSAFRLPGRIELVTILDFAEIPVAASVFVDVASDYHFTSSRAPGLPGSAYSVYFGAGETTIGSASPGRARARCVAGEIRRVPTPQLVVGGDVVADRGTELEWERSPAEPLGLSDAAARCNALGMRLPSIRELQSIVDETRREPALELEAFDAGDEWLFWSSTYRGADPWHVDFTDGQTYVGRLADEALASRCVR